METFGFLSADGKTDIHCVKWIPEGGRIRGVLQIVHGMVEFIERYGDFAEFLCGKGYMVAGHDHLGHGESVPSQREWGFMDEDRGSDVLVADIHRLRLMMKEQYPDVPYFMLGHSMGSFLLRKYLFLHGEGLAGAIISGTGSQEDSAVKTGRRVSAWLAKLHGWHYRSNFIQKMAFSGNDKAFPQEKLKNAWLCRDKEVVKAYNANPKCRFVFTVSGFYALFETIWEINRPENLEKMPKSLPMFFISGDKDPVGDMGKGVRKAFDTYKGIGMQEVSMKLYPEDRHEILNELDKGQVYEDVFQWLEVRCTA